MTSTVDYLNGRRPQWNASQPFWQLLFTALRFAPCLLLLLRCCSETALQLYCTPDFEKSGQKRNILSTPDLKKYSCKKNIWSTPDFLKYTLGKNVWCTPDHDLELTFSRASSPYSKYRNSAELKLIDYYYSPCIRMHMQDGLVTVQYLSEQGQTVSRC